MSVRFRFCCPFLNQVKGKTYENPYDWWTYPYAEETTYDSWNRYCQICARILKDLFNLHNLAVKTARAVYFSQQNTNTKILIGNVDNFLFSLTKLTKLWLLYCILSLTVRCNMWKVTWSVSINSVLILFGQQMSLLCQFFWCLHQLFPFHCYNFIAMATPI